MKLIGIIGKSGAGKTTLSRLLERDNSIAVIHLDKISNNKPFIKKMPKSMIQNYTNKIGEDYIIFNNKLMDIFYTLRKNHIINKIYINLLRVPQQISIKKQIEKYKKEGKKCVIIERIYIRFTSIV